MERIRLYLLSITSAALLCGILNGLIGMRSSFRTIIKLLSGLFLTITVISPIIKVDVLNLKTYIDDISYSAQASVADGKSIAVDAAEDIIKQKTEAYILDKAISLGLDITAHVTLSDISPAVPQKVSLNGPISPYNKRILSKYIADELGISKENQTWT